MGIQTFFIFVFLSVVQASEYCTTSYCGMNGFAIKLPFWLEGQQPRFCDSPGFKLSCNGKQSVIVNIPYSGEFYVSYVYYYLKRITLKDPNDCLPRRLLSLNLSSSPFMAVSYENYTFLSCPRAQMSFNIGRIDCLSNSTTIILATKYPTEVLQLPMCKEIVTLPVPVSTSYQRFPDYFELTWNVSTCTSCTSTAGGGNYIPVAIVIALSIGIPVLATISIFCCINKSRQDNQLASNPIQTSSGAALSNIVTAGLNGSTMKTYRTITIGESRLAGPNFATCTICLGHYLPMDTVRFMHECEHCFHDECIKKWLSVNRMCPLCRASQTHANPC